jgi:predicted dehydrogenase
MDGGKIRWGILSTAQIARKNWRAIQLSGNGIVAAVASRTLEGAQRFIAENQAVAPFAAAPRACGSYAELLAAPDVDAVYVPLPTGLRKEWLLRAAAAGKHIVSEKPCATGVADLREMLAACRRHRVQFMDGVMFMHSARLARMRAALDDGTSVGPLRTITSAFSFRAPEDFFRTNIRTDSALEPLGCLGDLGWYCVRLALWAARGQLPREATGRILAQLGRADSPAPVPTDFSGQLAFDDGLVANFRCSFLADLQQSARLTGRLGTLALDDFVLPRERDEIEFTLNDRTVTVAEHGSPHATSQETNLFRTFARQIRSGTLNEEWPALALKTQQVVNACWTSARDGGRPTAVT